MAAINPPIKHMGICWPPMINHSVASYVNLGNINDFRISDVPNTWPNTNTATSSGTRAISCGRVTTASGDQSVAIGGGVVGTANGAVSSAICSTALGGGDGTDVANIGAFATGDYSFAQGMAARSAGDYSVAIGTRSYSTSEGAVAIGGGTNDPLDNGATADGNGAVAIGGHSDALGTVFAHASANGAIAIGTSSVASDVGGIAIGNGATCDETDTVAIGIGAKTGGVANTICFCNGVNDHAPGVAHLLVLGNIAPQIIDIAEGGTVLQVQLSDGNVYYIPLYIPAPPN